MIGNPSRAVFTSDWLFERKDPVLKPERKPIAQGNIEARTQVNHKLGGINRLGKDSGPDTAREEGLPRSIRS